MATDMHVLLALWLLGSKGFPRFKGGPGGLWRARRVWRGLGDFGSLEGFWGPEGFGGPRVN